MRQILKNNLLTVEIDSKGAELQSVKSNVTGHEYLWQGDRSLWGRRSPVLFPIVGAVWNDIYHMDGKEYQLGQHGFARDMEFEIMETERDDEAWFSLESDDSTLEMYPREFRLEIGYRLEGERISVMWRVVNTGDKEMSFQIGAHPGFNYPDFNADDKVHGYFLIDNSNPRRQTITEKGCVGAGETPVTLDAEGMIQLDADTFSTDAIILADGQTRRVSMLDKNRRPYLSLIYGAPLVGLWSQKGDTPFVCIEPWWGRCDRVGFEGDFAGREYVNTLSPGSAFTAGYLIIIENI